MGESKLMEFCIKSSKGHREVSCSKDEYVLIA